MFTQADLMKILIVTIYPPTNKYKHRKIKNKKNEHRGNIEWPVKKKKPLFLPYKTDVLFKKQVHKKTYPKKPLKLLLILYLHKSNIF